MRRAIVLAGGGAKGAYQMGFWKAIRELGIDYQIVTGSSVGALNATLMAQGDFDAALAMWQSITTEDIIERTPTKLAESTLSDSIAASLKGIMGDLAEDMVKVKMDPFPLNKLLSGTLSEKLVRESGIAVGIMTTEYPSMKATPFTLDDIPYGMMDDYLLASSTVFPSMEPKVVSGKKYVDGGYSDNFPVNLALDLGAEEIIGVGLKASGLEAKYQTDYPVRVIKPSFDLGPSMRFDPKTAARNIVLGYNDTMKSFGNYDGKSYTFERGEAEKLAKAANGWFANVLYKTGIVPVSERNQFYKSLAVKAFAEATKQRFGRMKMECALLSGEAAAEIYGVDPLTVYSAEGFGKEVEKAFEPFENEGRKRVEEEVGTAKTLNAKLNQIKDMDKKDVVAYITAKLLTGLSDKDMEREFRALARSLPKEFFAALYLSYQKGQGETE